jgi:hypothetical protein
MPTVYVVTIGDHPTDSATTLQAAQSAALEAQTAWLSADTYTYRWDEYLPGQVWRLMHRHNDRKGRFSWTQRAVHAVRHIPA